MDPTPERVAPRGPARAVFAATVVAAVLTVLAACGGGGSETSAPLTRARSLGEATYLRSCARCHGVRLEGRDATPALDQTRLASLGDQVLRLTIATGKGKMPAFPNLTAVQVDALVTYLRTLR